MTLIEPEHGIFLAILIILEKVIEENANFSGQNFVKFFLGGLIFIHLVFGLVSEGEATVLGDVPSLCDGAEVLCHLLPLFNLFDGVGTVNDQNYF